MDVVKLVLYQHYAAQETMQTCWQRWLAFAAGPFVEYSTHEPTVCTE
jgi:hypothetical protein